jgi:hypothetical protein
LARELAAQGCRLFLTARREDRLSALCDELTEKHGIEAQWLACDLALPESRVQLAEAVAAMPVSILVNNAGFAVTRGFHEADYARVDNMLALNIGALTHLCHLMLPQLEAEKAGARILNVGSVAGHQGVPNMVAYAATKAYVNHFTEGLDWELRERTGGKIRALCLEPGQTGSEFFETAGATDAFVANWMLLSPEKVARGARHMLETGKSRQVIGILNKLLVFSLRLSPRWAVRSVISRLFRDMAA